MDLNCKNHLYGGCADIDKGGTGYNLEEIDVNLDRGVWPSASTRISRFLRRRAMVLAILAGSTPRALAASSTVAVLVLNSITFKGRLFSVKYFLTAEMLIFAFL